MDTNQIVTAKTGVQKIGKTVSNELPQVKNPSFNVRDRLNDILLAEKQNLVGYQIGINEIMNDDLRQIVINNRDQLQQIHTQYFNELFNLGEYQANIANKLEIADLVEVFTGYVVQLPNQQQ